MHGAHNKNQLEKAIAVLRATFTEDELREGFVKRTMDHEFRSVGWIRMAGRNREAFEPFIFVWEGYEAALGIVMEGRRQDPKEADDESPQV